MPRKDIGLSKAAQRIAEDLKRLADSDHPLRKLSRVTFPDGHPIRKFGRELANLPDDHPLREIGRKLQQLGRRQAELRELEAKKLVKKKTKPPLGILHLDDALDALATARRKKPALRSPKAAFHWIQTFLSDEYGVKVSDSQQRTIERRIASHDKSPR